MVLLISVVLIQACGKKEESKEVPQLLLESMTLAQANRYVEQSGFVSRPDGDNRVYDLTELTDEPAEKIASLMLAYEGDRAMTFNLKMAGASLVDEAERKDFLDYWLASDVRYFEELLLGIRFVGVKAEGDIHQAVLYALGALSSEQTERLLKEQGFLLIHSEDNYSIQPNTITRWPKAYLQICQEHLTGLEDEKSQAMFDALTALIEKK